MGPGTFGVFIPIIGLLIGGFVVVSRSEIGRAFAYRLRNAGRDGGFETELQSLREDVESLRRELLETQERLDFTERVLAGARKEG